MAANILLTCAVGLAADPRHEISFPDLPGYCVLKCELHSHTVFSDGLVWPTVRVEEAWREGLDALALTDHIEYQPHRKDLPTQHNRPFAIAEDLARRLNILLIKGTEITRDTPPGHHNALFLNDIEPLDHQDLNAVFEQAGLQKAFVFWNHPTWKGLEKGQWGPVQENAYRKGWLNGIEICNGNEYMPYAHQVAIEKKLTVVGNGDIHEPSLDRPITPLNHRTLTLVLARERSVEAVREALSAGRTLVWCNNQLIGPEEHLKAMFNACVKVHHPHHRTKNRVWFNVHNACELDIELERTGGPGPERLTLPAKSTTLVELDWPEDQPAPKLTYASPTFMPAPKKSLAVECTLPMPVASHPGT